MFTNPIYGRVKMSSNPLKTYFDSRRSIEYDLIIQQKAFAALLADALFKTTGKYFKGSIDVYKIIGQAYKNNHFGITLKKNGLNIKEALLKIKLWQEAWKNYFDIRVIGFGNMHGIRSIHLEFKLK
jgi:hypothetical protein